ncbi:MAG: MAPEG family protein [Hydrococcus sp. RM1_1_31]|nr:MAPEG family protein [Hydrococcus sp. RM1_1_31]
MSPFPSLITALTLLVYLILTINVGRARAKYKILPPATTGDPNFERVLRVQQNTLEQLVFFLPLLWLFSIYVSPLWSSGIGAVWIIGRIIFAWGYYQAAEKRTIGFAISSLSSMILLAGSLVGIGLSIIK